MAFEEKNIPIPSASLLHRLFDALHEIVCVLDAEGHFVYINKASFSIWGYHPEELIGVRCFDMMVEADKNESIAATNRVFEGAHIPTFENRYYSKSGNIVTMFWEGAWDFGDQLMYATGRDISEQKHLETLAKLHQEELQQTKQELEKLLDRITDGFIGLDGYARVTYWNKAAEIISNIPYPVVIGQLLWDVIPPTAIDKYMGYYTMVKAANKPVTLEFFSDRIQRWIEANTYVSGSGLSILFRDITDRKQLQDQQNRQKEIQQKRITAAVIQATEQERAYVGKELHDNVNQVLTTIKLYNELCLNKVGDTEALLKKSSVLLQDCINEIRDLSKQLAAPAMGMVRLKDTIDELVESINITNRVKIHHEHEENESVVTSEIHLTMYRILQEHLTNVLKHADAKNVFINVDLKENDLILCVRDDGRGFNVHQKRNGIGITNMETRVVNLNGSFTIESAPGQGTTLLVSIPIQNESDTDNNS